MGQTRLGVRALGRAIRFGMPMCSSRVLVGLESSARAWLRNQRSRADVSKLSPIVGCKYKRYVRYISNDEQEQKTIITKKRMKPFSVDDPTSGGF